MEQNFYPEQQKVIELHNGKTFLHYRQPQGSGKTAVLVERIIRYDL